MSRRIACTQCGAKPDWPDGRTEGFCPECGTLIMQDAPVIMERAIRHPGKAVWMLLGGGIATLLLVTIALLVYPRVLPLISPPVETRYEGPGFDTPEDAATAYLEALKALDLDAMVSTYAIETYVDNFDVEAMIRQTNRYFLSAEIPLVNSNDFARQSNSEDRKAIIVLRSRCNIIAAFFIWKEEPVGYDVIQLFGEDLSSFFRMMRSNAYADKLATLKITKFVNPAELAVSYGTDDAMDFLENTRIIYSADELTEVAAFFEVDGEEFLFTAMVGRYGDKWYLVFPRGMVSSFVNMPSAYTAGFARAEELDLSGYLAVKR